MANERIERLVTETNEILDGMEAGAGAAGDVKVAVRRITSLKTALEALPEALTTEADFSALDVLARELQASLPVKTADMEERLSLAQKALDAVGLLPDIPQEALEALLARAEAVFAAKPSTAKRATVRGIGVPIRVDCACGAFTRESSNGDWTSIRYQAKTHAEECKVANPDESGEFMLHLDNVRHAIVDERRESFKAGGLTFTLA